LEIQKTTTMAVSRGKYNDSEIYSYHTPPYQAGHQRDQKKNQQ
jgi:hypothetical protein